MKRITCHFDVISPFAYLAFERLPQALEGCHYVVDYHPVLLGALLSHWGQKGPADLGGSPASLWIYVDDSDALFNRALKAGATEQMPMDDQFWGDRAGAVSDPAGYTWWIATRKEDLTHDEIQDRAANFFQQMASQG